MVLAWVVCPEPMPDSGKIKVTMVVVLASEKPGKVDKCLQDLAQCVQMQNTNLKSFRVHSMTSKSVPVNQKTAFKLVDQKKAFITIIQGTNKHKRVEVSVHVPTIVGEIVYRCVCKKYVPFVTRYHTRKGERLIIAVGVEPCKGK